MNLLPQATEPSPPWLVRAAAVLLVPLALVLVLPLLLLVALALYLVALFHGGRFIIVSFTGKQEPTEFELQKPHFVEGTVKSIPDETTPST